MKIREMRENLGRTQQDISQYLFCDQSLYSKYERGEREIPLSIIIKLANLYKVSIDYLVGMPLDNQQAQNIQLMKNRDITRASHLQIEPLIIDDKKIDVEIEKLTNEIDILARMVKACAEEKFSLVQSQEQFGEKYAKVIKQYGNIINHLDQLIWSSLNIR